LLSDWNFPGSHFSHITASALEAKRPASHFVQEAAFAPEKKPGWQLEQLVDPIFSANLPGRQVIQAVVPSERFPTGHFEQDVDLAFWVMDPASQVVHVELLAEEYLPAAQTRHEELAVTGLNSPPSHPVHEAAFFALEKKPTSHLVQTVALTVG
jgi:hypothetical protein